MSGSLRLFDWVGGGGGRGGEDGWGRVFGGFGAVVLDTGGFWPREGGGVFAFFFFYFLVGFLSRGKGARTGR